MEQILTQFQNDEHTREVVKSYMLFHLDKLALKRVYEQKETKDIALAKEVLEDMFITLKEEYSKDKSKVINSPR